MTEMKVFISWSGDRSKQLATALHHLLPEALQDCAPWMSDQDIAAGTRWNHELTRQLKESLVGIICLTPENLSAPWLLFEAGALANALTESRVIPYRLSLSASDVEFPLAQFQWVDADENGTRKLLSSLNNLRDKPMPEDRLNSIFVKWWPDLANRIQGIPATSNAVQKTRSDRALIEEILELVRSSLLTSREPIERIDPYMLSDPFIRAILSNTEESLRAQPMQLLDLFIRALRARLAFGNYTDEDERALDEKLELLERIKIAQGYQNMTAEVLREAGMISGRQLTRS